MKKMKLSLLVGDHIDNVSRTASSLARKHNCMVRFDFNGISFQATPKKSPVTISWEYERIIGQHAERCRLSAAGQKDRVQNDAEVKSAQTAIDYWMLILSDMLRSGLDNTIAWLSNFLPLVGLIGTKVNYALLVGLFEGAGYKANECTGQDEAFYEVKENLGNYIIGQVLNTWKKQACVHQIACDFCEKYEVMRRSEKN